MYECETWYITLREERRLRVFDNRVLRRICGPKRDEVTGEWRKLHNEEINDLYSPSNIVRVIKSRRMRWEEHVERMGERRGVYRIWRGYLRERGHLEDSDIHAPAVFEPTISASERPQTCCRCDSLNNMW